MHGVVIRAVHRLGCGVQCIGHAEAWFIRAVGVQPVARRGERPLREVAVTLARGEAATGDCPSDEAGSHGGLNLR